MTFAARVSWSGLDTPPSPGLLLQYNITLVGTTVSLSLDENGTIPIVAALDVIIDWGDGTFVTATIPSTYNHTYASTGVRIVSLAGTCSTVSTLAQNELQGINAWNNSLGLLFFQLESGGGPNNLYVPDNLPSSLRCVRISGLFNDSSVVAWDTSNLTNMSFMFQTATTFNQPIGVWDTSAVTTMWGMFESAPAFNQDISAWSTDLVDNMDFMFNNASTFDQDISGWCVPLIPSLPTNFNDGGVLTPAYFPVWGTCPFPFPLPITLYGGGYYAFTGPANIPLPITLYGGGYNAFTGSANIPLPITLSR